MGVRWFLASNRQQPRQPGKVCRGQREDEAGPHPLHAAIEGLRRAADGLGPAEKLLDPLPVLLRQGITLVPRCPSVDCREPRLLRDMRGDAGSPAIRHEPGSVVCLVGAQGQLPGRSRRMPVHHVERRLALGTTVRVGQVALDGQPAAVLHDRVPDEA